MVMHKRINLSRNGKLLARFTLEEKPRGDYIATQWLPDVCFESDRAVTEFETYSAALAHMYRLAFEFAAVNGSYDFQDT